MRRSLPKVLEDGPARAAARLLRARAGGGGRALELLDKLGETLLELGWGERVRVLLLGVWVRARALAPGFAR